MRKFKRTFYNYRGVRGKVRSNVVKINRVKTREENRHNRRGIERKDLVEGRKGKEKELIVGMKRLGEG